MAVDLSDGEAADCLGEAAEGLGEADSAGVGGEAIESSDGKVAVDLSDGKAAEGFGEADSAGAGSEAVE